MPKPAPHTRPRPKQKPKPARRPLLPQHDLPAPYAALQTLGDEEALPVYEATANHIRAHGVQAGVEQLLKMALDESYYEYLDDSTGGFDDPRANTRLHAVRTLMQLKEAAEPAIVPLLPLLDEEDDWLREEMPLFYAIVGSPAIEPLTTLLTDRETDSFARSGAGDSLAEMTEQHPELRPRILPLLEQALTDEQEDDTLRAFLIINLMDIGARESLPLIEQAFAEDRVDLSVVQMIDVQEHFGLPMTSKRVPIYWERDEDDDEEEDDPEAMLEDGSVPDLPIAHVEEPQTPYVAPHKIGRNEPCPCGSGKKYKKCCGAV